MKIGIKMKSKFADWAFDDSKTARGELREVMRVARLTPDLARMADEAVLRHKTRQAQRIPAPETGRIMRLQAEKRAAFAVALGCAYDVRVEWLCRSKHATVVEGAGGQKGYDFNNGWPQKWLNGGARWETVLGQHTIIFENLKGKEMLRLPVPASAAYEWHTRHEGLATGDLFGVLKNGVLTRFTIEKGQVVKTGVSLQVNDLQGKRYWQKQASEAECYHAHLRRIAEEEAVMRTEQGAAMLTPAMA